MSPIERGERFQSGQYSTLSSLAAGVCREFDRLTDAVNSVEKNVKSVEKAAGASAISMPTAPTLSDGTLTPPPATWGYVQHLDKGDDYWLRKNIPQYSSGGSNNTGAIITARLYHGAAGKYDFLLLEQSLTIAAFVAVYEYDPNTKTYSSTPFYVPFLEAVTQIDSTNGYSDIDIAHPRITVNDHISIPIVAVFGQGGSAQTVYGDTEKGFVAGNGTSEPESPTLACTHKDIFYDDYTATFTRGYSTADPPSATSCNFYETLEIWIQNLATDTVPRCSSTDPDDCNAAEPPAGHTELCWYLEKEKDLKPRVKRLKNKSETGNWKVKFRIQHPEHRHPRVACRVLDKFGQLGEYNNHANTDESEGVKITALDSYKDDDGATQKIEYAVKLTVTKDSGAADPNTIRIKAQPYGTTKKFIQDFDYESDADTYTLDKHFKKGKQVRLFVKALYSGGLKSTNWIECLTSVTGYTSGYYAVGGAVTAPDAVQIASAEREGRQSVVTINVPADTKIGQIQIWVNTSASNPATSTAPKYNEHPGGTWKKIHQITIEEEERGQTIEVSINRPNAYKKYLAARAVSNEDTTYKSPWYDYGGGVYYFKDENSSATLVGCAARVDDTDEDQFTVKVGTGSSSAPTYRAQITKVKVRKKTTRVLHAIDCINPATGLCDTIATTTGFVTAVHHASGVHPNVYFKILDSEGNSSDWWVGESSSEPTRATITGATASVLAGQAKRKIVLSFPQISGSITAIKVYASNKTTATCDPTSGTTVDFGTEQTDSGQSPSLPTNTPLTSLSFNIAYYYNGTSSSTAFTDVDIYFKFCVCLTVDGVDSYWFTATHEPGTFYAPDCTAFNTATGVATIHFTGNPAIVGLVWCQAATQAGLRTNLIKSTDGPGASVILSTGWTPPAGSPSWTKMTYAPAAGVVSHDFTLSGYNNANYVKLAFICGDNVGSYSEWGHAIFDPSGTQPADIPIASFYKTGTNQVVVEWGTGTFDIILESQLKRVDYTNLYYSKTSPYVVPALTSGELRGYAVTLQLNDVQGERNPETGLILWANLPLYGGGES